ncbi:MAG: hypothetical protein K0R57_5086 [Paenibacillaceae bacterium]|nr:hypothetical protein [Paenibacillaceae bacterium]
MIFRRGLFTDFPVRSCKEIRACLKTRLRAFSPPFRPLLRCFRLTYPRYACSGTLFRRSVLQVFYELDAYTVGISDIEELDMGIGLEGTAVDRQTLGLDKLKLFVQ